MSDLYSIFGSHGENSFGRRNAIELSYESSKSDAVWAVTIRENECDSGKTCRTGFQIFGSCRWDEYGESNILHLRFGTC